MNARPDTSWDRDSSWVAGNQRDLMSRLALVRHHVERYVVDASTADGLAGADAGDPEPQRRLENEIEAAAAEVEAPALDTLCRTFDLTPFERDVLLMAAGVELDASFGDVCAAGHGDPGRRHASFGLALAALPEAHWSALGATGPLRHWRLVELDAGEALAGRALRLDEHILHFLTGVPCLDPRLEGWLRPMETGDGSASLPRSQAALCTRIIGLVQEWSEDGALPLIHLSGERGAARAIAAHACGALGFALHALRAEEIPSGVAEREALAKLWQREAVLQTSALLVETGTDGDGVALGAFLESVAGVIFVAGHRPARGLARSGLWLEVPRPGFDEQRQLWREALGSLTEELDGQLSDLVAHFSLGADDIRAASIEALHGLASEASLAERLWTACRTQARTDLESLGQRIEPAAGWSDLVLPADQMAILHDLVSQVRQRATVYQAWGFAARGPRGLGISALFAGASGTGKTFAAEVIANELDLDLYRIDLSQVVSKYIGETEKNLRRVFDAAEAGGAVLLFDEADALFGKRSEVKDSHDRYANIEISYLLQRMEAYRGVAILTTNLKDVLDSAFLRRLRFVVQFPFPDANLRAAIWRGIFPPETPTEGLDADRLARLNVTGGNIRNIALHGAFLAADEDCPVTMAHLLRAARGEYQKLDRRLTEAETVGWA